MAAEPLPSVTLTRAQMDDFIEQLARAKAVLDTIYLASDSNIDEHEGLSDFRVEKASAAAAHFVQDVINKLIASEEARHG